MEYYKMKELIEYCSSRKLPVTIINAIDEFLKEANRNNDKFLLALMEEIELQYPELKGDLDFYLEDIFTFHDEEFSFANPQIEYTYSYILNKYEQQFTVSSNISQPKENSNNLISLYSDPNNSFNCNLSLEKKKIIAKQLISEGFIAVESINDFVNAFSNVKIEKNTKMIKWLKYYNGKNDNICLAILLMHLSPEECKAGYKLVVSKVSHLFSSEYGWRSDSRSFETPLIQVQLTDYKTDSSIKVKRKLKTYKQTDATIRLKKILASN